ncbi:uncharacterized protein E1O_02180 [Burkholderiales bacterium GJ-E10]|nr:uncharacterized protein E1O_02180 [Burkholderiales bacterium GJ-E10]
MLQLFGYFTGAISGLLTLIGLFLQVADIFPAHREARKAALYISLGVFVGNILGMMKSISIDIDLKNYSPITISLLVIFVLIALSGLVVAFMGLGRKEAKAREESYGVSAVLGFASIGVLLAIAISRGAVGPSYSLDEEMAVAKYNFAHNDYARGIAALERAKTSLQPNDPLRSRINQFIAKAKAEETKDLSDPASASSR